MHGGVCLLIDSIAKHTNALSGSYLSINKKVIAQSYIDTQHLLLSGSDVMFIATADLH